MALNTTSLPKFQAILIFGDSILDTGNNNYIKTIFQANYRPYGRDLNDGVPTGRFCNGKLIPDMLASALRIKDTVPPYLDPNLTDNDLITGVNFASASAGFDERTSLFTRSIPIPKQIEYFKEYITRLEGIVGKEKAMHIISGALIIMDGGTNDFLFNIYDIPMRRLQFTARQYIDFILFKVENSIKELYDLGVRSLIVAGLVPIGFAPVQRLARYVDPFMLKYSSDEQNKHSVIYNEKLVNLLIKLQQSHPASKFVYADINLEIVDMFTNPQKYGFEEIMNACCNTLTYKPRVSCDPETPPCEDPSKYLFWDRIHPTSTAYEYLANSMIHNVLPKFLH
ncbi:GDSL esterase/lipase At2g30310-like [Mercurialis annua]|uniref:GDSL esterase/lipase At2g30310-like n=1 Tax=Mercurialis annua TaxID=3986 RepID=UPI0024AFDCB3|nr:GDSL esterase/lipase At2g30310-like [Mercurialis annua]